MLSTLSVSAGSRVRRLALLLIGAAALVLALLFLENLTAQREAGAQNGAVRGEPQVSGYLDTPSAGLPVDAFLGNPADHEVIDGVGGQGDSFFRVECGFSHFAYDDPIRHPGESGAAPLQMFFGNTTTSAQSQYWSLIDRGESTCSGGPLDRSAYAMPAVIDEHNRAVVPSYFVAHYNTHEGQGGRANAQVQPFPAGLSIAAGNPWAESPQDAASPYRAIEFSCDDAVRGDDQRSATDSGTIPACDPGVGGGQSSLKVQVRFPFCWDGQRLSSADGSHMSLPVDGFHSLSCPGSHPVRLPSVELNAFFDLPAGATTNSWRLSSDAGRPGGTTMHATWIGGWNRAVLSEWVAGCSNVPGARCAQGLLGENSGRSLRRIAPFFGPWNPFTVATADDLAPLCPNSDTTVDRCGERANAAPEPAPAPRPEPPRPEQRPAERSGAGTSFDTAWELPHKGSPDDIVAYLDHLDAAGFDGTWISLLPFGAAYSVQPPGVGDRIAVQSDGRLRLTSAYRDRVSWILAEASARDLEVGLVVAWARANTCRNSGVTPGNGQSFGADVAGFFGASPALRYWVLGGDVSVADCGGNTLLETSRALARGIRSAGAQQQIAFHTGAGRENYLTFNDEPWLDVQAVQTGHCQDADTMEQKLRETVAASTKPVILAESRYYLLAPPWAGCLHSPQRPVTPGDIAADVAAGHRAGVAGFVFGDSRRYQWCKAQTDLVRPSDQCTNGVRSTFATPGEQAFLSTVGRSG